MPPPFVLEGNEPNEWFFPLRWQERLIHHTYTEWNRHQGQGGSPTVTHTQTHRVGDCEYLISINGEASLIRNCTFGTERRIRFLPEHNGRSIHALGS